MNDLIKNSKSVDYVKTVLRLEDLKKRMLKKSEILLSGIS